MTETIDDLQTSIEVVRAKLYRRNSNEEAKDIQSILRDLELQLYDAKIQEAKREIDCAIARYAYAITSKIKYCETIGIGEFDERFSF